MKSASDRTLEILGQPTREVILDQLMKNGIILDNQRYYRLSYFEEIFKKIFGQDGASLVMKKLFRVLKEMGVLSLLDDNVGVGNLTGYEPISVRELYCNVPLSYQCLTTEWFLVCLTGIYLDWQPKTILLG